MLTAATVQLLDHVISLHAVAGLRCAVDEIVVRSVIANLLGRERLLAIEIVVKLAPRLLLFSCFLLPENQFFIPDSQNELLNI